MFYDVSDNINSKMTITKYIEILDEYVRSLLIENHNFILEENDDSDHEIKNNNNIVQQ